MNTVRLPMIRLSKKQIIIISGILTAVAFALKQTLGYAPLTVAVMLAATAVAGTPIFRKAIGALRYRIVHRRPGYHSGGRSPDHRRVLGSCGGYLPVHVRRLP
ncbi:MAG: hypothetical protein RBT68_14855 [Spirochaetia bacterium]|nr:hypothetical protein [Spirochaetia bacterium]